MEGYQVRTGERGGGYQWVKKCRKFCAEMVVMHECVTEAPCVAKTQKSYEKMNLSSSHFDQSEGNIVSSASLRTAAEEPINHTWRV